MGKKREDRTKEKSRAAHDCNLDGDYISPVRSCRDLSVETIRDTLCHSRYIQVLLSLTIIGFFLRFYNLGYNSLWLDEASTYTYASMSIPGIWEATTGGEFNPPLFYWTEHIMLLFGNSEFVLRFVPALLGVLTIPLVYLIGKEFFDRNVGIIAAAAFAFSPFLIYYSQEARAYAMMLFFVAAAMVFYLRALKSNDLRDWVLFGVLSALAFWSHFYGFVIIASLVLYALYVQIGKIQKDISTIKPLVLAVAVFTVICLPLIIITIQLFAKRTATAPTFGIQGIGLILETFRQISGSSGFAMALLLLLFVVGVVYALLTDRDKGVFLVSLMVFPFIISLFLSYRIPMQPRYLIFLSIIYFIGIAIAYKPVCTLISNRGVVYGFIALIVLLSVTTPLFVGLYTEYTKEDWRGLSGQVSQLTKPGDLIVVAPGYIYQPFDYYYSNSTKGTIEYHADNGKDLEAIRLQKGNNSMYLIITGDIGSANPDGDALAWIKEHGQLTSQNTGIYLFAVN
jgi:mannosyltransferase